MGKGSKQDKDIRGRKHGEEQADTEEGDQSEEVEPQEAKEDQVAVA